jgi:hypothetical protein
MKKVILTTPEELRAMQTIRKTLDSLPANTRRRIVEKLIEGNGSKGEESQ